MTSEHASFAELKEKILSREDFHPFPKYEDRAGWEALPQSVKDTYFAKKESILQYTIPNLNATDYMKVLRYSDDHPHLPKVRQRQAMLADAMLLECIEGKGELIDKLIDIVWAVCEESSWIFPRHNNHMHDYMRSGVLKNLLPDVTDYNFVDMDASMVASLLAWTYYMLKDRLDEESPLICKRIELEIMKRIVIPFVNHDDMTWCGFYGHKINNWNPYILSNLLPVFMIVIKDPDLRLELVGRAMEKLDIYINACNPDGGCDEGPGYWGIAGGSLFDCLDELFFFSEGKLDFFTNNSLIKNIGEYIVKANFRGNDHVNFADNGHKGGYDTGMLYHFAQRIGSDRLKAYAANRFREGNLTSGGSSLMFRYLRELFRQEEYRNLPPMEEIPQDDWFPDTEVLVARDKQNQLTAAAKGGFNNESHNHNDLGHFICSYEGQQIFVDLGLLPYTPKTFSPFRYEIWILQSAWHNCAAINGFDQHDGDDYKAKVLNCTMGEEKVALSLELKGAYEADAGISSYVRSFEMEKTASVWTVSDTVKLEKETDAVDLHFITVREPVLYADHVEIPVDDTHTAVMTFDAANWNCSMDTHDLESEGLKKSWDTECAYRIHLTPKAAAQEHTSAVTICVKEK